jgi:hypothetical protein
VAGVQDVRGDVRTYHKAKFFAELLKPRMPEQNLYCFGGMFLGWAIEQGLVSSEFRRESGDALDRFKNRQVTGPTIFRDWDGALVDDMLNDVGNEFARAYFDTKVGVYAQDFQGGVAFPDKQSEFAGNPLNVLDTWANYEALRAIVNRRFVEWQRGELPRRS